MTVTNLSHAALGDTYSSPFYDYYNDTLFVGDSSGYLYSITPVFNSTSASPVATSVELNPTTQSAVASPVYDATSGCVFVGDTNGFLYSVNTAITGGTVCTSGSLTVKATSARLGDGVANEGIFDGVLVDSTATRVYAFVTDSAAVGTCAARDVCVVQYTTALALNGEEPLGTGAANDNIYAGTFDNVYFSSSTPTSPSGSIYVIGNVSASAAAIYRVPIASNVLGTSVSAVTVNGSHPGWATPITEFCNNGASACTVSTGGACGTGITCTTGGTDRIFFNVYHSSAGGTCSNTSANSCTVVYNVNTTTPGAGGRN